MPKATWNGEVIAESDDTVIVEGNHYFPRESVRADVPARLRHPHDLPVEGHGELPRVEVDGETNPDAAWYYPEPKDEASRSPTASRSGAGSRSPPDAFADRGRPCRPRRRPGRVVGMRLLVLGGTRFLGRGVVDAALAAGDEVTTFTRGTSGEPPPGVEALHGDRNRPDGLDVLRGREWDAVVDTSGYVPVVVGRGAELLADRVGHYVFVSRSTRTPAGRRSRSGRTPRCTTASRTPAAPDGELRPRSCTGRTRWARSGRWTSTSPAGRRTCAPG